MKFDYREQIKSPNELIEGDPSDDSWSQITKNVGGIVEYVKVITTGNSKAIKNGVLGNSYFQKTDLKCNDIETNDRSDLYIYQNNKMVGKNGEKLSIINGIQNQVSSLNMDGLLDGFGKSNDISCVNVDLETVSFEGGRAVIGREKHHVEVDVLKKMNGCLFTNRDKVKNSKEIWDNYLRKGKNCVEGFEMFSEELNNENGASLKETSNYNIMNKGLSLVNLRDKPLANIYNLGIGALLILLAVHLMKKFK